MIVRDVAVTTERHVAMVQRAKSLRKINQPKPQQKLWKKAKETTNEPSVFFPTSQIVPFLGP